MACSRLAGPRAQIRPAAHFPVCFTVQDAHAHQVLDETPGNPAAARRVAGVGSGCSSPRGNTSRKIPRPGRGTALGCAGRTGARDLALGARRVDPVAGLEATATGTSRHDVNAFHLQRNARVDARLLTCAHARRWRARVNITPRTQRASVASLAARLASGLAWSSRDVRWPKPCIAHARPRLARSARPPGNQGRVTRRSGGAQHSLHSALGSKAGDHRWSSQGDGGHGAWTARELHSIAVRQYCGSKASNQALTRDGAPQCRRCQTKKKSRREERGRGPR
jgi:hypothetical protein